MAERVEKRRGQVAQLVHARVEHELAGLVERLFERELAAAVGRERHRDEWRRRPGQRRTAPRSITGRTGTLRPRALRETAPVRKLKGVASASAAVGAGSAPTGIHEELRALELGEASRLVVAKLDRLSRSTLDFSRLMANATREHWARVALDVAVDTSTPSGEAMANMLATLAQFEHRLISQRTKEALAVKRAQGVRLGRPPTLPEGFVNSIPLQLQGIEEVQQSL